MKVLLISYDNDDYIGTFPLGLGYLAAAARKAGAEVSVFLQDINHYSDGRLTAHLSAYQFDVVGVGMCGGYYQYRRLLEISQSVRAAGRRVFYVIGGHIVSSHPRYFLKKCDADAIVVGEGEETFAELLHHLDEPHKVKGVVCPGHTYEQRDPLDVNAIERPAYDLFPVKHYRLLRRPWAEHKDYVMPVLSGRGCQYKCNFCYQMTRGFRPRSVEGIGDEVEYLKIIHGINYIFFADDLLMSSKERVFEVCDMMEPMKIKWCCSGRLNHATPEVMQRMRSAGCVFINYGIESLDDAMLRVMHKHLTVDQITQGVEATLAAGISPGLNIIWGNLGETKEALWAGVDFLLKYDDGAQLRTIKPVTPYPGCELFNVAIKSGAIEGVEDFYENKHTNSDRLSVNFTQYTDAEFYQELLKANELLLENYHMKRCEADKKMLENLYVNDGEFRGFRRA